MIHCMRILGAILAIICLATSAAAQTVDVEALYQARMRVTGQGEETRALGFARGLEEVLIKLCGDLRLSRDPGMAPLTARVAGLVRAFSYRDLMAGLPVRDEQGTRDRPYELTIRFDRAQIDAVLRALGRQPWSNRPRVTPLIVVRTNAATYLLTENGDRGRDQREALSEAAERRGVPIALPRQDLRLAAEPVAADAAELAATARASGGDIALAGSLTWSDAALGWIAVWRLDAGGRSLRWQVSGVGFDDAFRSAMSGTAQFLSGNGEPQ